MVSVQMGRSSGFSQGGSYGSNRHLLQQQQQQQQPTGNASDLHLHAGVGDSFSPARGGSASYHSPVRSFYFVLMSAFIGCYNVGSC